MKKIFIVSLLFSIKVNSQSNLPPELNKIFFETSKFTQGVWLELPIESSLASYQAIAAKPDIYESGIPSVAITMAGGLEDFDPYVLNYLVKNGYARIETLVQTKHSNYGNNSSVYHYIFYSDDFKNRIKYFPVSENFRNVTKPFLLLAHRDLLSISYKNEYEDAPLGMKRTFYSIVFSYKFVNDIENLPTLSTSFSGKGKAFKDPDDGTWKTVGPFENLGIILSDNGNPFLDYFRSNYQPYVFQKTPSNNYLTNSVNKGDTKTLITSAKRPSNSNVLSSSLSGGNVSENFVAGTTEIYSDKKTKKTELANVLFMFSNSENQLLYQDKVIQEFSNWINQSIKITSVDVSKFTPDSVFKVELYFVEKFTPSGVGAQTFWESELQTRIYISSNGNKIKDDLFFASSPFMGGKKDKWDSLSDVINKAEKKLSKILDDYIPIQ